MIFNNEKERLFFALWPDDKIRQAINQLTQPTMQGIAGKIISPEKWHITLAFLGHIDKPTKACMQQVAATVQANRFELSLDQLGHWPKSRILWLGTRQTSKVLVDLVTNLTTGLQHCGYHPDPRPFQVHLTLMRKVNKIKKIQKSVTPIQWAVKDFCLVRSTIDMRGTYYQVIEHWLLN